MNQKVIHQLTLAWEIMRTMNAALIEGVLANGASHPFR